MNAQEIHERRIDAMDDEWRGYATAVKCRQRFMSTKTAPRSRQPKRRQSKVKVTASRRRRLMREIEFLNHAIREGAEMIRHNPFPQDQEPMRIAQAKLRADLRAANAELEQLP